MTREETTWTADPGIGWRIVLTAAATLAPEDVTRRLDGLAESQAWPAPAQVVTDTDLAVLLPRLATTPSRVPLAVGVARGALAISAHHAWLDGVSLLALLERITGTPVRTTARGLDRTPSHGLRRTAVRRILEALMRPPAPVAGAAAPSTTAAPDVTVDLRIPGTARTGDLIGAASTALVRVNRRHGRRARRIAIAVGAVQRGSVGLGDHSLLLRFTSVERLSPAEIQDRLRSAAPEALPQHGGSTGRGLARGLVMAALRLLRPRLGSTLLVSHLGTVEAPGVSDLRFYPVTAGGSGVALGAVGDSAGTTLTLRARHGSDPDLLRELLKEIGAAVTRSGH